MKRSELNNRESGSVMVETALIMPVLFLLIFFGVDLLVYSQGKTIVTQIARESAIYLATEPGTLVNTEPFVDMRLDSQYDDWPAVCEMDYNEQDCPHLSAQSRAYRMFQSARGFLDPVNSSITTTYYVDGDGDFVSVAVNVPIQTFFGMFSGNIEKVIKLRRVNI